MYAQFIELYNILQSSLMNILTGVLWIYTAKLFWKTKTIYLPLQYNHGIV